jgi:penicillin-binding protein 2
MRIGFLKTLTLFFFLLLILSLAYNQVIQGEDYLRLSQNNRIKLVRLTAARGDIYDRMNRVLAGTRLKFNVAILGEKAADAKESLKKISPFVGISQQELSRRLRKNYSVPFTPTVVAEDVSKQTAIALECRESEIPGLIIQTEPFRDYRYGKSFCHILGYLGSINEEELSRLKVYGLRARDLIGRSGIEGELDRKLRGDPGGMQIEVNNRGYKVRVLGALQAQKGEDVYLTVDAQLQELVDDLLEKRKGACVVMNPQNGEILAMVSNPGFDPNIFIAAVTGQPLAGKRIKALLTSKDAVLLNRAISSCYSPGSIFKVVVAAAGLETQETSIQERVHCPGSFRVGNRDFFCWKRDGHRSQSLTDSIAHSCNVFFYRLGLKLGADKITLFARKFGLGSPTGIDLPYEADGLVPSKSWKLKVKRDRWYDGETANFSIGQGYLLTTPLQMTRVVSAIANGGYLVQPHILSPGQTVKKKIPLKAETLEVIKEGMRRVIDDSHGTAHKASISGVQWAGKTGTAQASKGAPHGWFAGFFPLEQPRAAIVVFLENGGSGGDVPTAIARKIAQHISRGRVCPALKGEE